MFYVVFTNPDGFSEFTFSRESLEPVTPPSHRGGSRTPVADTKSFTTSFDGINAVYVDGKLVDSKYYTVSGKTVTLTEEFLKTLGNGQHSFRAESTIMKGESSFTVTSSKTGDMGIVLYAALALAGVTGSAIVIGKKEF